MDKVKSISGKQGSFETQLGDNIHKRIVEAEKLSYETCEICGEKGELRTNIGWYLTLCEKHYNEKHKPNIQN
jgi:ribosomal protein L37AE/L43A